MNVPVELDLSDIDALLLLDEPARGRDGNTTTPYDQVRHDGWRQVLDGGVRAVVLGPPFGVETIAPGGDSDFWSWLSQPTEAGCGKTALWMPAVADSDERRLDGPLLKALATIGVHLQLSVKHLPPIDGDAADMPYAIWRDVLDKIDARQMFRCDPAISPRSAQLDDGVTLHDIRVQACSSRRTGDGVLLQCRVGAGHFFALASLALANAEDRHAAVDAARSLCSWQDGTWKSRNAEAEVLWRTDYEAQFEPGAQRCSGCCSPPRLIPSRGPREWDLQVISATDGRPTRFGLHISGRAPAKPIVLEHLLGETFDILRREDRPLRNVDERLEERGVPIRKDTTKEPRLKTTVRRLGLAFEHAGVCKKWIAENLLSDDDGYRVLP